MSLMLTVTQDEHSYALQFGKPFSASMIICLLCSQADEDSSGQSTSRSARDSLVLIVAEIFIFVI